MGYVDSHSHLSTEKARSGVVKAVKRAQSSNIDTFIQGGIGPEDWQHQLELKKQIPGLVPCFGLHPYFVAENNQDVCEQGLNLLAQKQAFAAAIGETGLDFRPHIANDSEDRQIYFFTQQVEIAIVARKPIVLHIVRAHEEALRVLQLWQTPQMQGMVHAFNGSWKQAQDFLNLGLFLSIGCKLCFEDNQRLHQAVQQIPLDKLLLETDSPDQPPPGLEINEPVNLLLVAQKVAELKKLPVHEILDRCSLNARKLFAL